jgi:hypothetical protein
MPASGCTVDPAASLRFGLRRFLSVIWISLVIAPGRHRERLPVDPGHLPVVAWSVAVPALLAKTCTSRRRSAARALSSAVASALCRVLILAVLLALIVRWSSLPCSGAARLERKRHGGFHRGGRCD